MNTTIFKSGKKAMLLSATAMLGLLACVQADSDEHDIEPPRLTMVSPQEGQVFRVGDTIHISALVTDNESLHEYSWGIYDTAGVLVPSNFDLSHDTKENTITGKFVVGSLAAPSLWTVWVHADDYSHNYDNAEANIIVSP